MEGIADRIGPKKWSAADNSAVVQFEINPFSLPICVKRKETKF
jgi:hypothetical protein